MGTTDIENNASPGISDATQSSLTPYEKLSQFFDANEVALEKRVGLYRFCGTIGKGNFSQVKSATHLLTKGITNNNNNNFYFYFFTIKYSSKNK
jgi:hypothetical protein